MWMLSCSSTLHDALVKQCWAQPGGSFTWLSKHTPSQQAGNVLSRKGLEGMQQRPAGHGTASPVILHHLSAELGRPFAALEMLSSA